MNWAVPPLGRVCALRRTCDCEVWGVVVGQEGVWQEEGWRRVGLVVGLGVARRKRANGRCSFLAAVKMASPLSRQ